MSKEHPLYLRLYREQHLIDLARLVGYQGVPDPEFWERCRELSTTHGYDKMKAAVDEIIAFDKTTTPAMARLTPQARKLCAQLLGTPPEEPPLGPPAGSLPLTPGSAPTTDPGAGEPKAKRRRAKP